MIFPEGTTSNGTCILPFKRGAFTSLRTIKPIFVKSFFGVLSPAFDVMPYLALVLLNYCLVDTRFEIYEMPPFKPNDFLYTHHADKVNQIPSSETIIPKSP
jgi:lysophosphatidylcholine acyltransferase/lyso-PAF acetyltransferase